VVEELLAVGGAVEQSGEQIDFFLLELSVIVAILFIHPK
jgi:hypothetical protein